VCRGRTSERLRMGILEPVGELEEPLRTPVGGVLRTLQKVFCLLRGSEVGLRAFQYLPL